MSRASSTRAVEGPVQRRDDVKACHVQLCAIANGIAYSSANVENIAQLSPVTALVLIGVVWLTVIAGIIPSLTRLASG